MPFLLVAMWNELRKGLLIAWDYKFNNLMMLAMICIMFVGVTFFLGGGDIDQDRLPQTLLGFLVWIFAVMALSRMSFMLNQELQAGTFEQMMMSPAPAQLIILGRALATFVIGFGAMIAVGIILTVVMQVPFPMTWGGIPVLLVTIGGVLGFGFLLAGLTLVFKQVDSFTFIIQNALLFLNGSLLSIDLMPQWLQVVGLTLPTTQGIVILREIIIDGATLADTWTSGSLAALLLHSSIYLAVGWFIYRICDRAARRRGTMGHY